MVNNERIDEIEINRKKQKTKKKKSLIPSSESEG